MTWCCWSDLSASLCVWWGCCSDWRPSRTRHICEASLLDKHNVYLGGILWNTESECCFIKMVPVKIYVVLTPPRLIFGPNLSDTLIILPTHTLTAAVYLRLGYPHWGVLGQYIYSWLLLMILTCVNVSMFLHVRLLVKSFPTVLTGIWPSTRTI